MKPSERRTSGLCGKEHGIPLAVGIFSTFGERKESSREGPAVHMCHMPSDSVVDAAQSAYPGNLLQ